MGLGTTTAQVSKLLKLYRINQYENKSKLVYVQTYFSMQEVFQKDYSKVFTLTYFP